jgi:hypothetical protein
MAVACSTFNYGNLFCAIGWTEIVSGWESPTDTKSFRVDPDQLQTAQMSRLFLSVGFDVVENSQTNTSGEQTASELYDL